MNDIRLIARLRSVADLLSEEGYSGDCDPRAAIADATDRLKTDASPYGFLDLVADARRVDWIQAHPCDIKWNHERGWVVSFGFPFGEADGPTLRDAFDAAMEMAARPMEGR